MRYVCSAFVSEGPTDDRSLTSVINRATIDQCAQFVEDVEIADPIVIRDCSGRLSPMRAEWAASGSSAPLVFIVPVRETEAWAPADGDAIRRVYGVSWDNARLGVPDNPRHVAHIQDPKKVLTAIGKAVGGRVTNHHSRLGELVSLDKLAHVEAFAGWREDMAHVLEHDFRLTRQG